MGSSIITKVSCKRSCFCRNSPTFTLIWHNFLTSINLLNLKRLQRKFNFIISMWKSMLRRNFFPSFCVPTCTKGKANLSNITCDKKSSLLIFRVDNNFCCVIYVTLYKLLIPLLNRIIFHLFLRNYCGTSFFTYTFFFRNDRNSSLIRFLIHILLTHSYYWYWSKWLKICLCFFT